MRLPITNYTKMYFDGYLKDSFGNTPHPEVIITTTGSFTNALTEAPLPRAAFPTYTFQAKSGFGFNAAFPIQGIPVALSYLNSQQVDGSVTIATRALTPVIPETCLSSFTNGISSPRTANV